MSTLDEGHAITILQERVKWPDWVSMEFINGKWSILIRGSTGSLRAFALGDQNEAFHRVVTRALSDYETKQDRKHLLPSV
jgi:hypothetical protein